MEKLRNKTWLIIGGILGAYLIALGGQYVLYRNAVEEHLGYLRGNVRLLQQIATAAAQNARRHEAEGHPIVSGGELNDLAYVLSEATQPMNWEFASYEVRASLVGADGRMLVFGGASGVEPTAHSSSGIRSMDTGLERGLAGQSGSGVFPDPENILSLTAYAPLPGGLGGVAASVHMADVRKPFIITGLVICAGSLPVLLLALGMLRRSAGKAERDLLRQEIHARTILDGLADGVLSFDAAGRCVSANPSALRILGEGNVRLPSQKTLARKLGRSMLPSCVSCSAPCRSCEASFVHRKMADGDEGTKHLDIKTTPLQQDGQRVGAIMRLTDVTDLAEARRREEVRHRLDALFSEFANQVLQQDDVPILLQEGVEVIEESFWLKGVEAALYRPDQAEPIRWPERPVVAAGEKQAARTISVDERRGFRAVVTVPDIPADADHLEAFCKRVAELLVIASERLIYWQNHLQQERQYQQVLDDTADALCRFGPDGEIIFANRAYARLVGLSPAACIGENFYERNLALCDAGGMLGGQDWPRVFDARVATADEREVWYRWTVSRVPGGADGDCLQASGKDITELRRSRLDLEQRERILSATHSCSTMLIAAPSWDECTAALLEQIGRAADATRSYIYRVEGDAPGCIKAIDEWVAEGFDPIATRDFAEIPVVGGGFDTVLRILKTGRFAAFRPADVDPEVQDHVLRLGIKTLVAIPIIVRQRWWGLIGLENSRTDSEWSPVCLEGLQSIANALGSAIERQLALDEVVDRERFVNSLMQTIPEAVIVVDRHGTIIHWNRGATMLLGETVDEAVQSPIDRFLVGNAGIHEALAEAAISVATPVLPRAGEMRKADGTRVPVEVSIGRWHRENEALFSLIVRDIRHRLDAERQLRQAQKVEALGNLAGGIAHDFNNLLVPIVSLSDLLLDDTDAADEAREPLEMIRRAAEEARHLVKRILTFAREDAGESKVWDLAQVTRDALAILSSTVPTSVDVHFDSPPEPTPVRIRKALFHAALFNLVSNAVHAIGHGTGRIDISLTSIVADEHECLRFAGLEKRQPYARLVVKDTGHGMDETTLGRIFDPYFTTKGVGEGSGLGLMMVHDVVRKHGGQISVESREREGTAFTIHLPLAPEAEMATEN